MNWTLRYTVSQNVNKWKLIRYALWFLSWHISQFRVKRQKRKRICLLKKKRKYICLLSLDPDLSYSHLYTLIYYLFLLKFGKKTTTIFLSWKKSFSIKKNEIFRTESVVCVHPLFHLYTLIYYFFLLMFGKKQQQYFSVEKSHFQ